MPEILRVGPGPATTLRVVTGVDPETAPLRNPEIPSAGDILEALPYAAVIVDSSLNFALANSAFRIFSADPRVFVPFLAEITQPSLKIDSRSRISMLQAAINQQTKAETEYAAEGKSLRIKVNPLPLGKQRMALISIEDETGRENAIKEQLASAGHNLKNDLVPIIGFAELVRYILGDQNPDTEKAKLYADKIARSGRRAASRISYQLSAQKEQFVLQRVNCTNFLLGAVENISQILPESVKFTSDITDDLSDIYADPNALESVIFNVVSNSVFFMQNAGQITIRSEKAENMISIFITDTGDGIPAELHEKIFERDFTTRGQRGGNGIGLFHCRNIMRKHKGDIKVYESKPGEGTAIVLTIPLISTEV